MSWFKKSEEESGCPFSFELEKGSNIITITCKKDGGIEDVNKRIEG